MQPGLPTIQGTLEEIVSAAWKAAGPRGRIGPHRCRRARACAGGRVQHREPHPADNLRRAMNRLLPPAIRVLPAEEADADFHPRFDAKAKTYEYRIVRGEVCRPFDWPYVHHYPYPLDEERMVRLARRFEGEHDFSAFAASDDRDAEGRPRCARIFSSVLGARAGPPDLPRARQRLPETHGAQHGGHADRSRPRQYRRRWRHCPRNPARPRPPRACF